jgi:GNAT superfamily N-acetyltransferase
MIDARHYMASESLRNGLEICIRALRPDDGQRMAEAFSKLETDSIYTRFFGYKKGLTDADYRLIREMDFTTRVALIATLIENGREIVIASSSYALCGPDSAEIAFIVEEDYHGLGIARRLLEHLGRIARQQGIKTFQAEVLTQNAAMLKVFASFGWPIEKRIANDAVHVTLSLPADEGK